MHAMECTDSRRETVVAALASVLLHILFILGAAFALSIPAWHHPPSPPTQESPLELTIVPMAAPPKPTAPTFVTTSEETIKEPPKNAPFESDKNTRAASESAPSGNAPMPSLEGRESPDLELANRDYTVGKPSLPSPPAPAQQVAEQVAPPELSATPLPTPTTSGQLALREAPPRAKNETKPQPQVKPAQPKPAAAPGYQPETRVTRIKGNISNRGKAAVEAAATPLGRYKKAVSDAIGSRWYYYVNDQIGLLNIGTVDLRFTVTPTGKVIGVKVLSNTSNESFASVSINSIIEAEIPPSPDEVAKLLDNGRLEIDYSFTILSN